MASNDLVGKRVRVRLDEGGVVVGYNPDYSRSEEYAHRNNTYDVRLDSGVYVEWVPGEKISLPKTIKPGMRLRPRDRNGPIHDLVVVRKNSAEEDTWYLVNWVNPDAPTEKLTEDELIGYDEIT